jgi:threonyl-tRNA synthetase
MLVIGDKEAEKGGVTPRLRNGKSLDFMDIGRFIDHIQEDCRQRR